MRATVLHDDASVSDVDRPQNMANACDDVAFPLLELGVHTKYVWPKLWDLIPLSEWSATLALGNLEMRYHHHFVLRLVGCGT